MSSIRASITIDLPDGVPYQQFVESIRAQLSNITGLDTFINIKEIDDPISLSPIAGNYKKLGEDS